MEEIQISKPENSNKQGEYGFEIIFLNFVLV